MPKANPLPKLIVCADPALKGLHYFHDHRFICTADFDTEDAYPNPPKNWRVCRGSIIATMTDCQFQAQYAAAFAAAPRALEILRDGAFQFSRLTGEDLYQYARTFAALAKAVISQAEGQEVEL